MGLYYIGQKSRQIQRQTGLGAQFERIRQKKKAAAEQAELDGARVSLLQTLSKHVESAETETVLNDVTTHASDSNSRGRDRTAKRK